MARLRKMWHRCKERTRRLPQKQWAQILFVLLIIITAIVTGVVIRYHLFFNIQRLNDDTLLAWFGLALVIRLLSQQIGNIRGLSYTFGTKQVRSKLDEVHRDHPHKGPYKMFLRTIHFATLIFIVVLLPLLVMGTYDQLTNKDISNQQLMQQTIQEIQKNNGILVEQISDAMVKSNQSLIDRIDRLIEQNAEMLERLVVQNVSGNDTATEP